MFFFRNRSVQMPTGSSLYDQTNFYQAFERSLEDCHTELVIESPFITSSRMDMLLPMLQKLSGRGVKILVNTRNPIEHDEPYRQQAEEALASLHELGATMLYTNRHHRKIAIIDRAVLWEGSLNILSYYDSCEIMRKIHSPVIAQEMVRFLRIERYL